MTGPVIGVAAIVAGLSIAAAPPPKTLAKTCGLPGVDASVVRFGPRTGAIAGNGAVGVVLANTSDGTMCDWVANEHAFVNALAARYRVLLFDYAGKAFAQRREDMIAAAQALRAQGATTIVLGGGSEGGAVAIAAASSARASAVFGLSAAAGSPAEDRAAGRQIRLPLLLVSAKEDPYATDTRAIYRAAGSRDKRLLVVAGQTHAFFDLDPAGPRIRAAVIAFVAAHT